MSSNRLLVVIMGALLSSAHAKPPAEYEFHITRQSLVQSLNEFSEQTGLQIIGMIEAGSAASRTEAGPLIGQYTAEAAMNALLSQTGLVFRRVNINTIAVMSPARVPEKKGAT